MAPISDSLGPESVVKEPRPTLFLGPSGLTGLEKGFAKGKVLIFDDALSPRVVWRDANVVKVPALRKVLHSLDHRGPVVSDNFHNSAPVTKYLFEDEVSDGLTRVSTQWMRFNIGRERTATLHNVDVASRLN